MIASLIKGSYTESCHKKNSGNGAGGKSASSLPYYLWEF